MLKALLRRRTIVVIAVVVAGLVVTALLVSSSDGTRPARTSTAGGAMLHALATVPGTTPAATDKALAQLTQAIPAADRPKCATSTDPSFQTPAAQFPDGQHGLGIPFVAALTNGELLSGYHLGWSTAQHPSYPWALSLKGITGWVTGLLEVPSLKTVVSQTTGIMFCDDAGYVPTGKTSQTPPRLEFTLINDSKAADNTENYDLNAKQGSYAPYFFTLKAAGAPELGVTGVAANGAIDLGGSTAAETDVAIWTKATPKSPYKHTQSCIQDPGTVINISSTPGAEPSTGPSGAGLQFAGSALNGGFPAATPDDPASANLVGNDFPVSAFPYAPKGCFFSIALDGSLSGFGKQGTSNYVPPAPIASPPGWSQFTIKATITTLDLPVGAPRGLG